LEKLYSKLLYMEKHLDLSEMEETTHVEIVKKLVDELSVVEKKFLIKYIKSTMTPQPQPPQPPVSHTVTFSFK
jgi:hypothetical protein